MDFLKEIWAKAKKLNKKIVLPEADDPRILKAAEIISQSKLAQVYLIGEPDRINTLAKNENANLSGTTIVNPKTSEKLEGYAQALAKKREKKGMTLAMAKELMRSRPDFFAAQMVGSGDADGMVSGAAHTTADTLKAIIYCVGTAPGAKIISSFLVMITPKKEMGKEGIIFFADCAVIPNPNAEELAGIALSTAQSYKSLIGEAPRVALLSFSTKGSASHPDVDKVQKALEIARRLDPGLEIDGTLQADAALIPRIGQKKAPGSRVAGNANILIFPDLDAGNIGYKLTERIGEAQAIGPILQGAAKPVNDLSRGCSVEDIVNVTAITAVQT